MRTITVKVTDLGYEELVKTAGARGVSMAEIAEERLTEGEEYEPMSPEEAAAFDGVRHAQDRRSLSEWHKSLRSRSRQEKSRGLANSIPLRELRPEGFQIEEGPTGRKKEPQK